ncbi:hypothetical protein [Streptomyces sp. NPDC015680]|uniref:hypothetical protein n=1 Tax=Streptomyces sp. NPDC015680 TaxID=3364962 RepID=UPI0036F4E7E6
MRPDRAVPSPGTRALDELDQAPWAELRHAYGPATDVPEQLRALVCGDGEHRTQAWDRMWSALYHQGSVYEATLHAVPFLLHMLAEETTPHPARVLVSLPSSPNAEHGFRQSSPTPLRVERYPRHTRKHNTAQVP